MLRVALAVACYTVRTNVPCAAAPGVTALEGGEEVPCLRSTRVSLLLRLGKTRLTPRRFLASYSSLRSLARSRKLGPENAYYI